MITLLEGTPGAGKSYHAVSDYLLPWVKAGRRLYVYVRGFYLDRLAMFTGIPLADLEQQVTLLWPDEAKVFELPSVVQPGSAVFLDEIQTMMRARAKIDPAFLRWLETHRHYGLDILATCQDYRQLAESVSRLVEVTIKFRRLDRVGLGKRYQGFVRGNPEETQPHRTIVGRYDPKVYSYYESYVSRQVAETKRVAHVWRSFPVLAGGVAAVVAGYFFVYGTWLHGAASAGPSAGAPAAPVSASALPPPPPAPVLPPPSPVLPAVVPLPTAVRIQGGMEFMDDKGDRRYLWVDERGRVLTEEDIAVESGGTVMRVRRAGVSVLRGTGVIYGGVWKRNETDGDPWADRPGEKEEK